MSTCHSYVQPQSVCSSHGPYVAYAVGGYKNSRGHWNSRGNSHTKGGLGHGKAQGARRTMETAIIREAGP